MSIAASTGSNCPDFVKTTDYQLLKGATQEIEINTSENSTTPLPRKGGKKTICTVTPKPRTRKCKEWERNHKPA